MRIRLLSGIILAVLCTVSVGFAAIVSYENGVDGYAGNFTTELEHENPTTPQDTANFMSAGTRGTHLRSWVGMVSFSGIAIPAGQQIVSASLQLSTINFSEVDDELDGTVVLPVYGLLKPFSGTSTWNDQDNGVTAWESGGAMGATDRDLASGVSQGIAVPSGGKVYYSWDVTGIIANQYASGNYYGFAVGEYGVTSPEEGRVGFAGHNQGIQGVPPILTVEYEVIPEPTALALLGLGFAAMIMRRKR